MPKISFIIATRNRAKVIGETLQSLISQTEKDWEALIIDNGDDNTKEIVAQFNDDRFRYLKLQNAHGRGASCARNFGCIEAKSQIVAILDDDDIAYQSRSKTTLKAFDDDPKLDIFYGNFDLWYEKTGEIKDRDFPVYDFTLERLKKHNYIPHSTVAFKRQVLLDNPYNQFFKISEDYDLFTRLALKDYKFGSTKEKLLKYRINDDNISIGAQKNDLMFAYGKSVRMSRGWVPFDQEILNSIEKIEKEMDEKRKI